MRGHHISLFAGVGMMDIAAEAAGFDTIATAEIDPFCRRVLEVRLPAVTAHHAHYDDVRKIEVWNDDLRHRAGHPGPLLISGGFPCQDVSDSGTGRGLDGERSGLWSEFARVIREFKPDYVLIENSPRLLTRGLDVILNDLHHASYDAQWDCIPAAAVGAPHLRDRIWIGAKRRDLTKRVRDREVKMIGHVRRPGNGLMRGREPLTKLPRAGAQIGGLVFLRAPQHTVASVSGGAMWPTPTKSDGTGGPGTTPKRAGGKNLRTVIAGIDGNGRIDPTFVEFLMGLPFDWTNPDVPNNDLRPPMAWDDPRVAMLQRTVPHGSVKNRSKRIQALGNGLVPQVASIALNDLLNW